ncbi:xin actin-binding repeat-containing protein 1-like [Cololabis saira]|uniref:xin actin-binding repeat-containing protein 1-like n=1 Tax=Cololabis saira TaxID=129043 RepID=UPI002AD50262|nr:xin actin-binding repeat-containing protein 1-like [Cololabis saira]
MAEDCQQRKDDLVPPHAESHQSELKEISGAHFQQLTPSQLSKEMLHQQRQKCELRRLLKHTHPELKMLDDVVDEEFADVLSSETVTAGETGYEGEVLSRCLIFENRGLSNNMSSYTPKIHTAKAALERPDLSKPSSVYEKPKEGSCPESVKAIIKDEKSIDLQPDLKRESEEEMKRIDVQATKMIFENQSVSTYKQDSDKFQSNINMSKNKVKVLQNQNESSCTETLHNSSECKSVNTVSCVNAFGLRTELDSGEKVHRDETLFEQEFTTFSDSESHCETIKTSPYQDNPFISTNMEKEHSYGHESKTQNQDSAVGEDYFTANVKKRTHLFESMPFDKIRHQNKDEIETLVENIKETLNSLYRVKVIHSAGVIIEVNETMISKKAKFKISESGPELNYDEVAEGGAQNFILQLLPRVNLKTPITYLKEDSEGCMGATLVDVPANKDAEFKTAKVVQLVEDILNQDNSLRKGLIIQADVNNCAEVIVYSLYKYFDKEDVKSYSLPQRADGSDMESSEKRTISSPQETSQDQTRPGSIGPDEKGNVKLFKSCIEKGDLEYLKSLRSESAAQEDIPPSSQAVAEPSKEPLHEHLAEESSTEWVPVDVKKLKSMFSKDESHIQSTTMCKSQNSGERSISHPQVQNTLRECGAQAQDEVCNFNVVSSVKTQDVGRIHQAEPIKVTDNTNEISDPHTASHHLQEAAIKEQSLDTQKIPTQESFGNSTVSFAADNMQHSTTEALQENVNQKVETCTELTWNELPPASDDTTENKSVWQYKNTETYQEVDNTAKVETADTCSEEDQQSREKLEKEHMETYTASPHSSEISPAQEEEEEVVFQGKIQAALQSLERSNVNVSKGDFKAAMIYRNSYKPQREIPQNVQTASVQKSNTEGFCPVTQPESAEVVPSQKASAETSKPPQPDSMSNPAAGVVLGKSKRCVGPKPAIPPKPEHLKAKQRDSQPTTTKNLNTTLINKQRTKETVPEFPQASPVTSISCKDECKQDQFKSNESEDHQRNELLDKAVDLLQETELRHQVQGLPINAESHQPDESIINRQQEINVTEKDNNHQNEPGIDNKNEIDENRVDFHEACQKFGGTKELLIKTAPPKPKRVRIAIMDDKNPKHLAGHIVAESPVLGNTPPKPVRHIVDPLSNTCGLTTDSKDKHKKEMMEISKVEMREKRGRIESEDERRQRLSVHMDEIMRGNITTAMEIFDNLQKQEQLQSILSRVEEIEKDTSKVDVRSLRKVFENVPDWVVSADKKKQNRVNTENRDKRVPLERHRTESQPSMAHVYGDLERASEEIMNLKEQTLARLVDIEESIRKALYSVSTLKSDSDIAGLSCLFKESLGTVQSSSSSGNISNISIGSSRMKSHDAQESFTTHRNTSTGAAQTERIGEASAKQPPSPPSTPSFISIQSAARKRNNSGVVAPAASICPACQQIPKTEERFRTTKTLTCNSPAQTRKTDPGKEGQKQPACSPLNSSREISVLEVQTDSKGNSVVATKSTNNFGNQCYSSKAVIVTQPETIVTANQALISPSIYQVTNYPEV